MIEFHYLPCTSIRNKTVLSICSSDHLNVFRSLSYVGPVIFNNIPLAIRLRSFKAKYKEFLIENFIWKEPRFCATLNSAPLRMFWFFLGGNSIICLKGFFHIVSTGVNPRTFPAYFHSIWWFWRSIQARNSRFYTLTNKYVLNVCLKFQIFTFISFRNIIEYTSTFRLGDSPHQWGESPHQ